MLTAAEEKLKNALTKIPRSAREYPKELHSLSDAPEVLYAYGDVSLLRKRKFTVVGSRRTPANILKLTESVVKELSDPFAIVTGSAEGGDSAAIEGGLQGSGKVICVLAGGFSALPQGNLDLLRRVAKKGLLISPHSFETEVRAFSYEYRNKLLAALGEGALITAAGEKSGALITAKYAKSFSKPIFAFPYPPGSAIGAGCNGLLKSGEAMFTESANDVFERFGLDIKTRKKAIELTEIEHKAYDALQELGEGHLNELAMKSGLSVFKLRATLSALEVKGLAVSLGGNRYAPV